MLAGAGAAEKEKLTSPPHALRASGSDRRLRTRLQAHSDKAESLNETNVFIIVFVVSSS